MVAGVILAVSAFVPGDAAAGQPQRCYPAGPAEHRAVHGRKVCVACGFRRGDRCCGEELLDQRDAGDAGPFQGTGDSVALKPAQAQGAPSGGRRGIDTTGQLENCLNCHDAIVKPAGIRPGDCPPTN